jgi:hypothetical protein
MSLRYASLLLLKLKSYQVNCEDGPEVHHHINEQFPFLRKLVQTKAGKNYKDMGDLRITADINAPLGSIDLTIPYDSALYLFRETAVDVYVRGS